MPVFHEKRIYNAESGLREIQAVASGLLQQGQSYTVVLRFNKPMRLLNERTGEVELLPGQTSRNPAIELGSIATGTNPEWIFDRARELSGFSRYPGDTLLVTLDLQAVTVCGETQALSVDVGDLVGHRLDSNPSTVVDWTLQGWINYEDGRGVTATVGGPDTVTQIKVECGSQFVRGDCNDDGVTARWISSITSYVNDVSHS